MSCVLGMLVLMVLTSSTLRADTPSGVKLPARSKFLSDGSLRWELAVSYGKAVAHIERSLKRAKVDFEKTERIRRANVKFTHFRSRDASTQWEHINVSTYDGGVYVLILPGTDNRN